LNLGLVPLDRGARALERCLGAEQALFRPLQGAAASIDRLVLAPDHVGDRFTQGARSLVEHELEAGQAFLLLVEPEIASVRRGFPLVGDCVALLGDSVPLLGNTFPLILSRFAMG
jgi:hypothetical protein